MTRHSETGAGRARAARPRISQPAPSRRCRAAWPWLLAAALSALAPHAHADVSVDIHGVQGDLRRNVTVLLSLERYRNQQLSAEAVQSLFNRIDSEVRTALRPYGYYSPRIRSSIASSDHGQNWQVSITIDPGVPIRVDKVDIRVIGAGAHDPIFTRLLAKPPLHHGEILNDPAYDKFRNALEQAAATYGYLDAQLLKSELRVDPAGHRADVELEFSTGARYRFGATRIEQHAIRQREVRRFLRYRQGAPYNAVLLLRTQFALDDSEYFSSVEVRPGTPDRAQHTVPITIRTTNAHIGFSIGAGYGTDTGARGTFSLTIPRVNSYGHRFRFDAQLSQIQQTFDSSYDVPFGDPALEKFSLEGLAQQTQYGSNLFASRLAFRPSVTQILGRWQRVLSLTEERMITEINGAPVSEQRRVANLLAPGIVYASVPAGYLGQPLFARELYAQLLGSARELGAPSAFLRLDVQAERVVDLAPLWQLLLRGELGANLIGNVENLPGQYRFFAGGARSIRGFAYDDLSPVTLKPEVQNGLPVPGKLVPVKLGGRELIVGSIEIDRDLPHNLGIALFFDGGNAVNHFGDPLAFSVGIGLRVRLPAVTVGIDIGQALRAPGYPKLPGPRLDLDISPKL